MADLGECAMCEHPFTDHSNLVCSKCRCTAFVVPRRQLTIEQAATIADWQALTDEKRATVKVSGQMEAFCAAMALLESFVPKEPGNG